MRIKIDAVLLTTAPSFANSGKRSVAEWMDAKLTSIIVHLQKRIRLYGVRSGDFTDLGFAP